MEILFLVRCPTTKPLSEVCQIHEGLSYVHWLVIGIRNRWHYVADIVLEQRTTNSVTLLRGRLLWQLECANAAARTHARAYRRWYRRTL